MKITKRRLGAELILHLEEGYDPEKLENWANIFYHDHVKFLDPEVRLILQDLMSLTSGPEFEMEEKEIQDLALKLINE
jgi:hypothetical protein